MRNACAKEEKDGCTTKQECTVVLGWNTCSNARPDIIVAVGDSSLVLSTIGKCLDEERVFDIQSVLDNIDQIHSDAAGVEQAEERLEQVLRGVFVYCHGVHHACLKAVVALTAELMCTLQVSAPRRSAYDNWQIIIGNILKIRPQRRGEG